MTRKMVPQRYDAEKHQVLLTDGGSSRADFFVEKAVDAYLAYGEVEQLAWAIRNALPEVMENDLAKELLAHLVEGKPVRKRGYRRRSRDDDARHEAMFKEVWFFIGQGFPAYINPESRASGPDACEMAAKSLQEKKHSVYRVWRGYGGRNPEGFTKMAAKFYESKGRQSVSNR